MPLKLLPWRHGGLSTRLLCYHHFSTCHRRVLTVPTLHPPLPKKNSPPSSAACGVTGQHDPYRWMSDPRNRPDLLRHLRVENAYAEAFMEDTVDLRRELVREMSARCTIPGRSTVPERWGPWLYYQYVPEGRDYPVLCRRWEPENDEAANSKQICSGGGVGLAIEEVVLDWNKFAEQYGFVDIGSCRVSPNHQLLAFTVDTDGSEQFLLHIKNISSGQVLPAPKVQGVVSLAWASDSSSLFYTVCDKQLRPYSFCVDITATKDGKFITVYLVDATNPFHGLGKIWNRVSNVRFFVEHHYGSFYILTDVPLSNPSNWDGEGFYLAIWDGENTGPNVIFPTKDVTIQDMDIFKSHLVLSVEKDSLPMLCAVNLPISADSKHHMNIDDLKPWFFPMPSTMCSFTPGSNHDFSQSVYRVVISSPVIPDVILDYDMSRQTFTTVHQEAIRWTSFDTESCSQVGGRNAGKQVKVEKRFDGYMADDESMRWEDCTEAYSCESFRVNSHDGFRIPLTVVYSRGSWKRHQSPGLLLGYGAYGEVLDNSWVPERVSLLDRGWLIAFADVRGGGGVNSSWHISGTGPLKQNSINDYLSCAKFLVEEGYVHDQRLCAMGYSAGCVLVGAALNLCPDLFRGVILKLPFLDICDTLQDPSLPLSVLDYQEFGDPHIKSHSDFIKSYSPYDNIRKGGCHASALVCAAFNDARVGVWEAAKWVAKVRDFRCSNCCRSVILRTDMNAGHLKEDSRTKQLEETAFEYAFLLKVVQTKSTGVHRQAALCPC
ncbi:hypothetical protein MLD38_011470 [Melastoma candidum]|uniref:Uncharacterized protein n=1 Tax=Melastoma candidum TaxID=119954 RepID=A0ACB9R2L6_9MYRT|nr:hypothetical protein MLD38_011470 [Melastoma candidum]